jgi:hypothetical protein
LAAPASESSRSNAAGRALASPLTEYRPQHAHLLAVEAIALAELRDQVAFLEPDADQDVVDGRDREPQMAALICGAAQNASTKSRSIECRTW